MLNSVKARANFHRAQRNLQQQIKQQTLKDAPSFIADPAADPRHVEFMLAKLSTQR